MLAWRADKNRDNHVKLLVQCKKKQLQQVSAVGRNTFKWFIDLNPSLLLSVCEELLLHCGVTPLTSTESVPRALKEAKALFADRDLEPAQATLLCPDRFPRTFSILSRACAFFWNRGTFLLFL